MGHSMGGHGALIMALNKPNQYKSCSAFAPIVQPSTAEWSRPAFEKYLGKKIKNSTINNSFDLSDLFLSKANIATVPGDGFGASGFVRFSFATSEEDIVEGLSRIKDLLIN